MSIILIGTDGKCFCNCASKCVLGRCGSAPRCTKEEIQEEGYKTFEVAGPISNRHVMKAMTIDGKEHYLKIRDVHKKRK